jgi:hypothetical protein
LALRFFQLGCMGFWGALGFIPDWHRLWGFTGFFGFFGVAWIVEGIHRLRAWKRHRA